MFIIKLTNKYSGDTGFVESISSKESCFHNTADKDNAKRYKSESIAKRMIATLALYGEAENNNFEIIPA